MNKKFSLFFVLTIFFSLCVESIHAQRICNGMGSSEALPTKCFEIENILVNACSSNEGHDEMVRIRIGPNPFTLNTINNVEWTTTNSWLGWATFNTTNLGKLTTINNQIASAGNCGRLIKLNPNDVAPAYSRVLIITSTVFSTSAHDFSDLTDTLYVALHNSTNITGHFTNQTTNAANTFIVRTNTCGDTVTFFGNLMVKLNGTPGSEDGSGVRFSYNGTASYYNYGCALPNNLFTVDAGVITGSYCSGASVPIQGSISGNACYYWYPQNRNAGTVTDSTKLITTFNISPSFSGSVKLYLVAYGNCSTVKDSVIFNVNPATTSISITALANSNWCNRKTISLSAISGSPNSVLWSSTGLGTFTNSNSLNTAYVPSINDTGNIWIRVNQLLSCGVAKDSIRVYLTPSPSAHFSPVDTIFCLSQAGSVISLNPQKVGGTFYSNFVTGTNFNVPNVAGIYPVKYLISLNGCSDSVTKSMHVQSQPNAFFTLSDTLICLGSKNIIITPQASGGVYSGITIVGNTFIPSTSGTYVLTNKIVSGNCVDSFSRTIYVLPKPNASFTVSDTLLCEGNLATLTPAVAGGLFSGSYVNGNVFTSVTSGVFPVKYTITQNGCSDSAQRLIYVEAKPDASFSASDTILCKGALDIILTPNYVGGIFYGIGVIGDKFNYNLPGKYEVSYVINNKSCSDSSTKFILVNDNPDADFSLSDSVLCEGDLPISIVPKTIGGIFTGIVIKDDKFNPSVSGVYDVKYAVVVNGCKDSTTKKITVFAKPIAKFSVNPNPVITFDSAFFTYTGGSVVNKYSWSFGDGKSSSLSNPVHIYDKGNSYQVWLTVTNSDGCLDSIVEIVLVEDDEEVFIPNVFTPNDDSRNDIFKLIITTAKDFSMTIYNRWGGLVFESNNFNVGWDGISNGVICPEGVYVYVVTFKNARGLEKKLHGTLTLIR
jgi:gliding motility-associated-like protein